MNGTTARPLQSLKVLDLSTLLPGPYASLLLADLGADVLRIESATRPDLVRHLEPQIDGASAAHHYLNRNKRSLALDLKQPAAVEIVKQLIQDYDILLEQFRPGVMARLGLDYDTLSRLNPRLIYCSITGYGQTGPYRDKAGHDLNYLALSGVSSYTGRQDQGPLPLGLQVADIAGGSHHAVMGILAAVIQRQHSGQGQQIDISMTDAAFALNGMAGAAALANNQPPRAEADWLNGGSFYDYYRTSDDRFLAVAGLEPVFVRRLADALEAPELLDLQQLHDREKQQQLKTRIATLIASRSLSEWQQHFAGLDACVEPVLDVLEAARHPQLQARDMVLTISTRSGDLRQAACPIHFSGSSQAAPKAAAAIGEDGREVLAALGYSEDQVTQLIDNAVLQGLN